MFNLPNTNNSIIANNQTTTTFRYGTTQDTYIIFSIVFAVDAYQPDIVGINSLETINGIAVLAIYLCLLHQQLFLLN
jgi:hypothetical protein